MNEKIERLISEINGDLDAMEAAAENAGDIKSAARRCASTAKVLADLADSGAVPHLDVRGMATWLDDAATGLTRALPIKSNEMQERLEMAQRALDASGLLPDIPEDDLREVLARAEQVFAFKPSATGKAASVRGIGVPIRVECGCGDFVRESKPGDWTSIRYQAKTHAAECRVANPDESGEWTNDFDEARRAVVDQRVEFTTGGLTFSLPGGAAVTAVAPVEVPAAAAGVIENLCFGRVGRMAEVFDLIEDEAVRHVAPDAMFLAGPNVITVSKGWVHASCKTLYTSPSGIPPEQVSVVLAWDMQIPLNRWVALTIDLTAPNDDRDIIVE